jgi:hypothetical protein
MATPRTAASTGEYLELSELTSLKTFITNFAGHIAKHGQRGGGGVFTLPIMRSVQQTIHEYRRH